MVDPAKAIEWSYHQVEAVPLVFSVLMEDNRNETLVPVEFSELGQQFTDYICEMDYSLNEYIETELKHLCD